jgi:hypothetical protein
LKLRKELSLKSGEWSLRSFTIYDGWEALQ